MVDRPGRIHLIHTALVDPVAPATPITAMTNHGSSRIPNPPGRKSRFLEVSNRLKQSRRIATRYAKRAVDHYAMLTIGMIKLWL